MKKLGIGLVLTGIVGCGALSDDASPPPAEMPRVQLGGKPLNLAPGGRTGAGVTNHVVMFRTESIPANAASAIAKAGGKLVSAIPSLGLALVSGPASFDAKINTDADVLASAPDFRIKLPKGQSLPASLPAPPPPDQAFPIQWDIRRVNAPAAWQNITGYGNVKVAVIDTGVMYDHPEFNPGQVGRRKTYAHCVVPPLEVQQQFLPPGVSFPQDREGYPEYSAAFIDDKLGELDPGCYLGVGTNYQDHGTHVAGTVGANVNPATLTVGVAPGVPLLAYRVFERIIVRETDGFVHEEYGADDFNIFMAIDDAVANGASVINMSLGSTLNREIEEQNAHYLMWERVVRSATRRGTLVVAAAGNENMTLNGEMASVPSDLSSVISVGATGTTTIIGGPDGFDALPGSDVRAEYSNTGASVDIVAPGGDCGPGGFNPQTCNPLNLIFSSVIIPYGVGADDHAGEPGWTWNAGTSMASPHVAGAAALVRAKWSRLTPAQVKSKLTSTAQAIGPRQQFGAGMLDAAAATSR